MGACFTEKLQSGAFLKTAAKSGPRNSSRRGRLIWARRSIWSREAGFGRCTTGPGQNWNNSPESLSGSPENGDIPEGGNRTPKTGHWRPLLGAVLRDLARTELEGPEIAKMRRRNDRFQIRTRPPPLGNAFPSESAKTALFRGKLHAGRTTFRALYYQTCPRFAVLSCFSDPFS